MYTDKHTPSVSKALNEGSSSQKYAKTWQWMQCPSRRDHKKSTGDTDSLKYKSKA